MMPICKLVPAGNLTPNLHVSGGGEVVIPLQRVDDPYTNINLLLNSVVVFLCEVINLNLDPWHLYSTLWNYTSFL